MLSKLSCVSPSSRIGILRIRIFELYSKKRYKTLKSFGVVKGAVCRSNRHKKFLLGYKIKSYVMQTKQSSVRPDGTLLKFFINKTCIKHRKLQRHRKNYGPVQKIIKKKKFLFKFARIV